MPKTTITINCPCIKNRKFAKNIEVVEAKQANKSSILNVFCPYCSSWMDVEIKGSLPEGTVIKGKAKS